MVIPKFSIFFFFYCLIVAISSTFGQSPLPSMEPGKLWSDKTVPYTIDPAIGYSFSNKIIIESAMYTISEFTCVKFVKKTNQTRWLTIQSSLENCTSVVGSIPGRTPIKLSKDCLCKGIILHGLYHAIGMTKPGDPPIIGPKSPKIRLTYDLDAPGMCNKTALNPHEITIINDIYGC